MMSKEYLLAELRAASLRARIIAADIDAIGMSVKEDILSPEDGVKMIIQSGLVGWFSYAMENALKRQTEVNDG
jgi:hypothetical protein